MKNILTDEFRETNTHFFFWNTIYSQWYRDRNKPLFEEDDKQFWTAEHYMMYHKARVFNDEHVMKECLKAHMPGHVKALGREIKNFDDKLWNEHKIDIVTQGSFLKFSQNEDLLEIMKNHQDLILVEASPYDKIWGIGKHFEDEDIIDESNWRGENLLGICLMKAREKLLKS